MSIQQMLLGASGASGYLMDKSLRFRSSADPQLNRTPATTSGNQTWTYSAWVKRGALGTTQCILAAGFSVNEFNELRFNTDDTFQFTFVTGGADFCILRTSQVFRDPSAWYHVVVMLDTTQATSSNRAKIYINGVQVTAFSTATYPSLNQNWYINQNVGNRIGSNPQASGRIFDGYLAEINMVSGQNLTPASFGETNALTGVWQPKAYTGTYGTNGFYLDFEDTSSVAALGTDKSGNGNTWTVNNISLTSGVTYDSMTDVPTLTSATASNYAVLNPLDKASTISTAQGNLYATTSTSVTNQQIRASIALPSSGKFYWETKNTGSVNNFNMGLTTLTASLTTEGVGDVYYNEGGVIGNNGSNTSGFATLALNDIVGVAVDVDANKIYWYKNNTLVNSGGTTINITAPFAPMFGLYNSGNAQNVNFGQQPFAYTPPTGFVALNTFNLPTATILKGNTVMDATLYTGNGSTQTITNAAGFQPDLVWVKSRSSALEHKESNAVRGATKATKPNSTDPETTDTNGITAFNSNGFSLGTDSNYNTNAATYAAWQWKAGNTISSNTDGSITSTVSVNASAGFSILTFNGTGANATVGHGLGVAPSMFIVKNLTNAAGNWAMAHSGLSSFSGDAIYLNSTAAQFSAGTFWNSTAPTSSVINLGSSPQVNESAQPIMAQVWAAIAGYSSFGTYTGNGSTDGTFVYTGFRPKVIWIKNRGAANGWRQYDTTRSPYNLTNLYLQSSSSAAEQTSGASIDILSNGFKIRDSDAGVNGSGSVYIYACWAENPTKYALAR